MTERGRRGGHIRSWEGGGGWEEYNWFTTNNIEFALYLLCLNFGVLSFLWLSPLLSVLLCSSSSFCVLFFLSLLLSLPLSVSLSLLLSFFFFLFEKKFVHIHIAVISGGGGRGGGGSGP
jgi:hypothetical protein